MFPVQSPAVQSTAVFKAPPAGIAPARAPAGKAAPPQPQAVGDVVELLVDIRERLARLEVGMAALTAEVQNLQAGTVATEADERPDAQGLGAQFSHASLNICLATK